MESGLEKVDLASAQWFQSGKKVRQTLQFAPDLIFGSGLNLLESELVCWF